MDLWLYSLSDVTYVSSAVNTWNMEGEAGIYLCMQIFAFKFHYK